MTRKVLLHRYDNELDILEVAEREYSDVFDWSRVAVRNGFDLVAVIPTGFVSELAVVGTAAGAQEKPVGGEPWPGKDAHYGVRVCMEDVRYTTFARIRTALVDAGQWKGQWKVKWAELDERDLFDPGPEGYTDFVGAPQSIGPMSDAALDDAADVGGVSFDPRSVEDARDRVLRAIAARRGQPRFRETLLEAYGSRCAISGCDAPEALEAAHIVAYRGPATNHVQNGLLLRADLHTLFDRGLLAVDPDDWRVRLHPDLASSSYAEFEGQGLRLPASKRLRPSAAALRQHIRGAGAAGG